MKPIKQIQSNIAELQELLIAIEGLADNAPAILYKLANEKAQIINESIRSLSPEHTPLEKTEETAPSQEVVVEPEPIVVEEEEKVIDIIEEVVESKETAPAPIASVPFEVAVPTAQESTPRKELRKSLTLNDRFLFRRELFGNSDATMHAALDAIQQCATYPQAIAWIEEQYNWDNENDVVVEFLALVEKNYTNSL